MPLPSPSSSGEAVLERKALMKWDQLPNRHDRRFSANDVEFLLRKEVHPALEVVHFRRHLPDKRVELGVEIPQELLIEDPQIAQRVLKAYYTFTAQELAAVGESASFIADLRQKFWAMLGSR